MHEHLELYTQSKLGDTDSTGDAEEYKTEFAAIVFASALLALLDMLFLFCLFVCFLMTPNITLLSFSKSW